MEISPLHAWDVNHAQARELQNQLAARVDRNSSKHCINKIAGIDVSITRFAGTGRAAIVVLDYPSLKPAETAVFESTIGFPYVPGLLSFREAPLIIEAWKQLKTRPDIIIMDGQGIAHPRRFGIASHLGLLLDTPTIGCAKSRLTGTHDIPAEKAGSFAYLTDAGETIGAVLRTKGGVKPLFISIGHKIDLAASIDIVLKCCRGFRLPEPTRMAHMAAGAAHPFPVK
jgi:deoxyribonuclease V